MEEQELLLHYELMEMPGLGLKAVKSLLLHFGKPSLVFQASKEELKSLELLSLNCIQRIKKHQVKLTDHPELHFLKKHHITVHANYLENYPSRLIPIEDAPSILYSLGNVNMQPERQVAIIGTRNNTDYGKVITQEIVKQLKEHNIQIISGLAEGIDGIAHKACIENSIPTVGVLGHGLDMMFPAHHKSLAQKMMPMGGLITEYPSGTIPHKTNFPMRNRIVAGLADFILVVETKEKGGAMITAQLGFQYNKEIGAIPGPLHHMFSKGCNQLIKSNIASLIEDGGDILQIMNWQPSKKKKSFQIELFSHLNEQEQAIIILLQNKTQLHFDEILHQTQLSYSTLSNILLHLELQDYIVALPGKMYQLGIAI